MSSPSAPIARPSRKIGRKNRAAAYVERSVILTSSELGQAARRADAGRLGSESRFGANVGWFRRASFESFPAQEGNQAGRLAHLFCLRIMLGFMTKGSVAEWSNAPVSNTGEAQTSVSSNLTASAKSPGLGIRSASADFCFSPSAFLGRCAPRAPCIFAWLPLPPAPTFADLAGPSRIFPALFCPPFVLCATRFVGALAPGGSEWFPKYSRARKAPPCPAP